MSDRWVNAVITIRLPLDVDVDASGQEKLEAAGDVSDEILNQVGDRALAVVTTWEVVGDGESAGVTA